MRVAGTALLAIADCFLLLVEFACSAIGLSKCGSNSEISKFENAIKSLDEKSLNMESFDSLFQGLLKSPLVDKNWEAWTRLMDRLVKRLIDFQEANPKEKLNNSKGLSEKAVNIIARHKHLAEQIRTSPESIPQFCKYLESEFLNCKYRPWAVYIIFETYKQEFSSQEDVQHTIDAACKRFLQKQATNQPYEILTNGRIGIDIDPRKWFGPFAKSREEIPELLKDVLWKRIQSLHPSKVTMIGRAETPLPYNFTLPLAKLITDAEITLVHNGTIDPGRLSKPQFAPNAD